MSNGSACFVVVRNVRSFFRFIQSRHSSGIMEEWIRFTLALVSRILVAVRITVVVGPYVVLSLSVGFAVWEMSLTCRRKPSGLDSKLRIHGNSSRRLSLSRYPWREIIRLIASWLALEVALLLGLSREIVQRVEQVFVLLVWGRSYCITGTRPWTLLL